jgi:hypothetical protein
MLNVQKNMNNTTNYYLNQKPKLLKEFDKMFHHGKKVAEQLKYDVDIDKFYIESKSNFEKLIPEIPYIGGKKNRLTWNLTGSVMLLAMIRSLEKEGFSEREIGKIIYYSFDSFFKSKPKLLLHLMGKLMFSKSNIKKRQKQIAWQKSQNFTEGWVSEFVPGDGKTFDAGIDYSECGICKFYEKHDAKKYITYLCLGDYPTFQAFGVGLTRTQTIGHGADTCDFRIKKGGTTPDGWPPENLDEWTSKKQK